VLAVILALDLLAAPLAAEAQPPAQIPRIGYLAPDPGMPPFAEAFLRGLRERGYIEGKNIRIEWRFAGGSVDLLPILAAQLARLEVDVIVADSTIAVAAAKRATTTIPKFSRSSSMPSPPGSSPPSRGPAGILPESPSW
jgi:putative ABC transport system substrate-binding protein